MNMFNFKHDYNKVIESCAETLKKELGFNPAQVIRHFQIFSMDYFRNTPKVPKEEIENWYYLRETLSHAALIFNYKTKKIKFIDEDYKWKDKEFINEFKKSEDQLKNENELYVNRMEEIINSYVYKRVKPLIAWYFACPIGGARDVLPTPNEFILKVLEKYSKGYKIEDSNIQEVRDSIFDAYFYEERKNKENR